MLELALKINAWRLPPPRALAAFAALAAGAVAVIGLLTPAGHKDTRPSAGVPIGAAPHGARAAGRGGGEGSPLNAALGAQGVRLGPPAVTAAIVVCGHVVWSGE